MSPEGQSVLATCDLRMNLLENQLFGCLSDEELGALRQAMQKVTIVADEVMNFARPGSLQSVDLPPAANYQEDAKSNVRTLTTAALQNCVIENV